MYLIYIYTYKKSNIAMNLFDRNKKFNNSSDRWNVNEIKFFILAKVNKNPATQALTKKNRLWPKMLLQ